MTQYIERTDQSIQYYSKLVDTKLESLLSSQQHSTLISAAKYSCLAPAGKKIRPFLTIEWAKLFGVDIENVLSFAAAIEMIHTYSLIHDDLPALDNDNYRRNQLSCHKKFDEAIAILTGNSLLTFAFEVISKESHFSYKKRCQIIDKLSSTLGFNGMVYGQMLDIEAKHKLISLKDLETIHMLKTAKFMSTACIIGAILGDASQRELSLIEKFGDNLGMIFQITDDILDKDIKNEDECNITSVIDIDRIKNILDLNMSQAIDMLTQLSPKKTSSLKALLFYLRNRIT